MSGNTFLSPTAIAREILRILHGNLTFTKNVNRQYDSQFANSGATMSGKIGPSLTVKYPNRYTVRTGAPLSLQDTVESSTTVSCSTQKGVDMYFTSSDLTLTIDDFSGRYLKPAGLLLASTIDSDGLALYSDVYQTVGETGANTTGQLPASALVALKAKQKLAEANCPQDGMNTIILNPASEASMVNALTGFFNPQVKISEQYTKGMMSKDTLGFDWYMDQNVQNQTYGTRTSGMTINGLPADGATQITLATAGSTTYNKGDVFTIANTYSVNPETKQSTGSLQQFVVTQTITSTAAATLSISPTIQQSGATQNMTGITNGAALTFMGTASAVACQNLAYHKDAFTFVSADLVLPKGIDFAAREVFDGVSVRIVRAYDINNDRFPCRIDVLYGWKTLYPQLACRISG